MPVGCGGCRWPVTAHQHVEFVLISAVRSALKLKVSGSKRAVCPASQRHWRYCHRDFAFWFDQSRSSARSLCPKGLADKDRAWRRYSSVPVTFGGVATHLFRTYEPCREAKPEQSGDRGHHKHRYQHQNEKGSGRLRARRAMNSPCPYVGASSRTPSPRRRSQVVARKTAIDPVAAARALWLETYPVLASQGDGDHVAADAIGTR